MAYRRRQQQVILTPSSDAYDLVDVEVDAAKAIRASSAHKDSSFSSAYGYGSLHSASASPLSSSKDFLSHQYASMKYLNESKQGFWVLSLGKLNPFWMMIIICKTSSSLMDHRNQSCVRVRGQRQK